MYRNDCQINLLKSKLGYVSECQHAKWTMIVKLQPNHGRFSYFALLNS